MSLNVLSYDVVEAPAKRVTHLAMVGELELLNLCLESLFIRGKNSMVIGVPKEIKKEEYRVGIIPEGVHELINARHRVIVEEGAGEGSGVADEEYIAEGAMITDKESLFNEAELIVKVKEPVPEEYHFFKEKQALLTFLHLASNLALTDFLIKRKLNAFGYETLEKDGDLPLLTPMSEIAGRMAPIVGSYYLQKCYKGNGVFPAGAVGVRPAKVVILGAGTVGVNAARISFSLGMDTTVLNRGFERLTKIDELFSGRVSTLPLTAKNIEEEINSSDIVIGAVLVPGGKTPKLITRKMFSRMKKGAVIVDVSIDQGGCCETSRPTTHEEPVYVVDGIIHYTVANMPGAYPRTSTLALTNATLPYIKAIAEKGIKRTIAEKDSLRSALNTFNGRIMHKAVSEAMRKQSRERDLPNK